jgi:hypothetical protein
MLIRNVPLVAVWSRTHVRPPPLMVCEAVGLAVVNVNVNATIIAPDATAAVVARVLAVTPDCACVPRLA